MKKRVRFRQLRVGMFIEEIEYNGVQDGNRHQPLLIEDTRDLQRIGQSKAMSFVINVTKGLDVEGALESPALFRHSYEQRLIQKYDTADIALARSTIGFTLPKIRKILQSARATHLFDIGTANGVVAQIMKSSANSSPGALIELAKLKIADEATFLHCLSVSALMVAFGRKLKLDEETIRLLGVGGLLHDIGKMIIPNEILNKTGGLTKEEFAVVQKHPEAGSLILMSVAGVHPRVQEICLHHHEKFDGTGYPHKLSDQAIPLCARIAAICDVYDALTTIRPYKRAFSPAEAVDTMLSAKGHFDPKLLGTFVSKLALTGVIG